MALLSIVAMLSISNAEASPVAYNTPMVVPSTFMVTVFKTITPVPTATVTPTPRMCVEVVWDKDTNIQGLNLRNGASMGDNADGRSYLGPGFIFEPLGYESSLVCVTIRREKKCGYVTFAKVVEPSWYIAKGLWYKPDNTYTKDIVCP